MPKPNCYDLNPQGYAGKGIQLGQADLAAGALVMEDTSSHSQQSRSLAFGLSGKDAATPTAAGQLLSARPARRGKYKYLGARRCFGGVLLRVRAQQLNFREAPQFESLVWNVGAEGYRIDGEVLSAYFQVGKMKSDSKQQLFVLSVRDTLLVADGAGAILRLQWTGKKFTRRTATPDEIARHVVRHVHNRQAKKRGVDMTVAWGLRTLEGLGREDMLHQIAHR